jgi:hypothetical protein
MAVHPIPRLAVLTLLAPLALAACTFGTDTEEAPSPAPERTEDPGPAATAPAASPSRLTRDDTANVAACRAWVDTFNGLPCLPAQARLDAARQCPPTLDRQACDQTAYWDCVTSSTACDAGHPTRVRPDACPHPCGEALTLSAPTPDPPG